MDRSAVRRERDFFRIRASEGGARARRAIARAILAHRARALETSTGPRAAHRRDSRRVWFWRRRDFRVESQPDHQLRRHWISRALTFALVVTILVTIATVQGCSTQQPSNGAVAAVPSAQPSPKGAPLGSHAPYAITAGLDGNLWFTEYQGDGIGQMTPYGSTKRFQIDPDGFAER